jgi:hypothetical protein
VRFSAFFFSGSSQADQFGRSDAVHGRWVGLDPEGGTDPYNPRIVWSGEDRTMDRWVQLSVTAQARGGRVSVFVRAHPDHPVKHNDVLVDDAELVVVQPPPAPADGLLAARGAGPGPAPALPTAAALAAAPLLRVGGPETVGALDGAAGGAHAFFAFEYPGGEAPHQIAVTATPDDPAALARFGFRVYGPRSGNVYVMSGLRVGQAPNVVGVLPVGEAGRYLVDLYNFNPAGRVEYRLALTRR